MAPLISSWVRLLTAEVLLQENLVALGDGLHEHLAVLVRLVHQVGRDLLDLVLGAHGHVTLGIAGPHQGTHVDEVDDADEVVLGADRDLQHEGLAFRRLTIVSTVK